MKLLRVLQTGEIERLGDDRVRRVNVRLVAATNVDLQKAIAEQRFRSDLYYRLATYPVTIPPLRERRSDIPLLAAAMIEKFSVPYSKTNLGLSERAIQALQAHHWPGNVRELENLIERGVLLAPSGGEIEVKHLFSGPPPRLEEGSTLASSGHISDCREENQLQLCEHLLNNEFNLESHEMQLIRLAVRRSGGNLTHAARKLGLTRRQLAYRLHQKPQDGD